jgi:hypothetical protein
MAGHSVHVLYEYLGTPGMISSSGGTKYGKIVLSALLLHALKAAPEAIPIILKKSRRFISLLHNYL